MTKNTYVHLFMISLVSLIFSNSIHAQRSNCASSPYPITLKQSDGADLLIFTHGTEALYYKETSEGYTVLPNGKGDYEYAISDANGNLQLSGVMAKNEIRHTTLAKTDLPKHIRFSALQEQAIVSDFFQLQAETDRMQKSVEVPYPVNGSIKVLAICMQFPDLAPLYPISALQDLMSQPNYQGTGSFADYFRVNSYGKLNVQVDFAGWYTSALNRQSYGRTLDNGSNNSAYMTNVRNLIAQAIDSADTRGNIDFTQYDNDSNGEVDGIIIFHAGYGAEQGFDGYIWSHRSSLFGSSSRTKDGVLVRSYCINPTKRSWGGVNSMVGLGVLTHEFGHIMGLPDLYDTQGSSEGIGNFGLMGACGWLNQERTPCQLEVWSKDQFGWITPIVINNTTDITLRNTLDSAVAIRINTPRANEYFLIENRQRKGWDLFLPGRGLAIWHINSQRTALYPGSNTVNTDTSRFGVGLKQADGMRHLEFGTNRGDNGDLYPGTSTNRNFNDNTNPNSKLHFAVNGVKQASNVSIANIFQNPDSTISFRVAMGVVAAISVSPLVGCVPLTVALTNASIGSNDVRWYMPDGSMSTTPNTQYVLTTPGQFSFSLVVLDSNGQVVDSISQQVVVNAGPNASFTSSQIGDTLFLNNTSTGSDFGQWRFSSGSTSTANKLQIRIPAQGFTYYYVAYTNNSCTDTAFGSAIPFPTSVTERVEDWMNAIVCYPNPIEKKILFSIPQELAYQKIYITLYTHLGELIMRSALAPNLAQQGIDLPDNLASGVYMLHIVSDSGQRSIKLVKTE